MSILSEPVDDIVADNRAIRDRFVSEIRCLTIVDVESALLSVCHRGTEYLPAFQFRDDGQPHTVAEEVLSALPEAFSNWQRALWFVSTNGWLDDKSPMDSLGEPDAVIAAARREREEVVG